MKLDAGFRIDLLVEKYLIVELKVVENLLPVPQTIQTSARFFDQLQCFCH